MISIISGLGRCRGHLRHSSHQLSAEEQQDGLVVRASCQRKVTDSISTISTACCVCDILLSCPEMYQGQEDDAVQQTLSGCLTGAGGD